jgi:hypothetical protein
MHSPAEPGNERNHPRGRSMRRAVRMASPCMNREMNPASFQVLRQFPCVAQYAPDPSHSHIIMVLFAAIIAESELL